MSSNHVVTPSSVSDTRAEATDAPRKQKTGSLRMPTARELIAIFAFAAIGLLAITFKKDFHGPFGVVVNLLAALAPALPVVGWALTRGQASRRSSIL
jgi:hypothetical protein